MSALRAEPNELSVPLSNVDDPPRAGTAQRFECDRCERLFDGPPAGAGLFVWTRGGEVRYEEPPLCEECACRVATTAFMRWALEADEE